jgi:hypothetical protein
MCSLIFLQDMGEGTNSVDSVQSKHQITPSQMSHRAKADKRQMANASLWVLFTYAHILYGAG